MLKKTSLAVIGLIANGAVFSGSMGPVCTPGNVTVPCAEKLWDLGIQALYLRSVYDTDQGFLVNSFGGYTEISNDWEGGFRLEGSYHFNTGNDISINWTHYHGDATIYNLQPNVGFGLLPQFNYTYAANNYFDQVNLEMGQLTHFGQVQKMRFYGGLQYASIKVDAMSYSNFPLQTFAPAPLNVLNSFNKTDFNGIGPLVGIDYSYDLISGFSLTANGSGSVLVGTGRYNAGSVLEPLELVTRSIYGSKRAMVPSLEAKLGLNYSHHLSHGVLNVEGGYQAMNYFNALQGQYLNVFSNSINNSDYSLFGPYFGVKYIGLA